MQTSPRLFFTLLLIWNITTNENLESQDFIKANITKPFSNNSTDEVKTVSQISFEDLRYFCLKQKFVSVLFNSGDKEHAKFSKMQKKLAKHCSKKNVFFAEVLLNESNKTLMEASGIHIVPSFYIYVEGHKKHYTGEPRLQNIKVWIKEVISAKPVKKRRIADIDSIDKHYFVYASQKIISRNKSKFLTLAKLISPLSIYTGFDKSEVQKLLKGRDIKSSIWIYREYKNEVTPIDLEKELEQQAQFIVSNEFPAFMECNNSSLRFIKDFKIPVLVYFSNTASDKNWDFIKEIGKEHKEFLITVLVKPGTKNRCANFLRLFLNVQLVPALRILSLAGKIKRHLFLGNIDEQHVRFFLNNYVNGNLKSYVLNQKLTGKEQMEGLKIANHKLFKEALADYNRVYLIYIFDGTVKSLKRHLEILKQVKDKFAINKTFSVYVIDHDKNDLDGFYNSSLPLVFLIAKKGKMVHFDEKIITSKGLISFIQGQLPYLKIEDELKKQTDL